MGRARTVDEVVSIAESSSEQGVLERLVEVGRTLTSARYGAAVLLGPDGEPCALAHLGMSGAEVAVLPHLPRPLGLIAAVLRGDLLRLADMRSHPEGVGFPAGHVAMAAFLGVPVTVGGRVLGGLLLTRSPDRGGFTAEDEACAVAAARQAGAALDGLRQRQAHSALIDRLGIASSRSEDGGTAQEPSEGIRLLLAAAREVLGMDVTFLSRLHDGAQTFTHVDAGPSVGAARSPLAVPEGLTIDAADGYCGLLTSGALPPAVPDVPGHPVLAGMAVTAALGVGAYCGVPVTLSDGSLHGTLCGLHPVAGAAPTPAQIETLRILARLIGRRVEAEQAGERDRRTAAEAFGPMLDGSRRTTVLQPIVDLATGAAVGYEALSRFTEPTGAPRRPDEVFARAHSLGLGLRLEQAAVRSALALLPHLPAHAYLSVNLSPQALLDPASFDLLTAALASGAAGRLVLELTEHERVPDYSAVLGVLAGLRPRGLRLAVDDTGSGFASLQHVTRLRPDIVKLDIAFVRDIDRDPPRRAVARALLALAAEIGAVLVAEGVESEAERDELLRLGATHGQGYLLGRPSAPSLALAAHPREDAEQSASHVRQLSATSRTA